MERAQLTGDHRPSAVSRAALAGAGEGRTCKGLQMSGKVLKIFFKFRGYNSAALPRWASREILRGPQSH